MRLAVLQPHIPHYRELFFKSLATSYPTDLFCYSESSGKRSTFSHADIVTHEVSAIEKGPLLLYNPNVLLKKQYTHLVLMLHFGHLTTWVLLLTKFFHKKKIVLWGQGISVKRYLQEEAKPDWKLHLMMRFADAVWLYTEKEEAQWKAVFQQKPLVALSNTLYTPPISAVSKDEQIRLKHKYNIIQPNILIFSARFENPYRRTDLLEQVIQALDPTEYGFIIIGDGKLKPDFSKYSHVYDFGKMYDDTIKKELFAIADIYFQPGWVGLSIVEAMRHSLPIFTFRRTEDIKQCVEYHYIKDKVNGRLFDSIEECVQFITSVSKEELIDLGKNARNLAENKLTVKNMVDNALKVIK